MAKNKKQEIINATTQIIAEKGFEGMRTRALGELAGVNHATIHYHFKDKETLIEAVVQDLLEKIYQSDIDAVTDKQTAVPQKLRTYFYNNLQQRQKYPERFAVLRELTMRAVRDHSLSPIIEKLDQDAYGRMQAVIHQGIQRGEFRETLDAKDTAVMLISLLRGIHFVNNQKEVDQYIAIYQQIEKHLLLAS